MAAHRATAAKPRAGRSWNAAKSREAYERTRSHNDGLWLAAGFSSRLELRSAGAVDRPKARTHTAMGSMASVMDTGYATFAMKYSCGFIWA